MKQQIKELSNRVVGDPLAKVNFLVDCHEFGSNEFLKLFQYAISVSYADPQDEQHAKLNFLLTAFNLDENIINGLQALYLESAKAVLQSIRLHETLKDNDIGINLKYCKLINLLLGNLNHEAAKKLHQTLNIEMQEYLNAQIQEHLAQKHGLNANQKKLIAEVEQYITLCSPNKIEPSLAVTLSRLLSQVSKSYSSQIDFKYTVRVKYSNHTKSVKSVAYNPCSNKGLLLSPSLPAALHMQEPSERKLTSLSLVILTRISSSTKQPILLWEDMHFMVFVFSLLKCNDPDLRCSSLQFLLHRYLIGSTLWRSKAGIQKLLPYLIESFNVEPLPVWFNPFDLLIRLTELYNINSPLDNAIGSALYKNNLINGFLAAFYKTLQLPHKSSAVMKSIESFTRLCAELCANDEKYRTIFLSEPTLVDYLESCLQTHVDLLRDFLQNSDLMKKPSNDEKANKFMLSLPCLYDADFVQSWLLLLKSFSRSASALRTTLQRPRLSNLQLQLVRLIYSLTQRCFFVGYEFLQTEIDVLSITLAVICNFVVDFSKLQISLSENGIVELVGDILTDPLFNPKSNWGDHLRKMAFEGVVVNQVKINSLWVLRNLMYNCNNDEKLKLLEKIPLTRILDFINDSNWAVQEQCFQLIRNLTCNSRKVVNILLENFDDMHPRKLEDKIRSTYLFEFLVEKMKLLDTQDEFQRKTLEGILYIIVNIAAINENKKELLIEQDDLLRIMADILQATPEKPTQYGNESSLKLACLLVLHNLLWDSTLSNYVHYSLESYSPRNNLENQQHDQDDEKRTESLLLDNGDFPEPNLSEGNNGIQNQDSNVREARFLEENSSNSSLAIDDTTESMIVQPNGAQGTSKVHVTKGTRARCRKLVQLGIYDLIKNNIFNETLDVREKARTLTYVMDSLRRE